MGKMVEVEIVKTGEHFQIGRVVQDAQVSSPGLVEPLPKGMVSGVHTPSAGDRKDPQNSFRFYVKIAMVVLLVAALADVARLWLSWT